MLHSRLGLCIVEDLEGVISNDKLAKEQKPPVEHKLVLRWNNEKPIAPIHRCSDAPMQPTT
jgi:hypothetical protein